MAHYQSELSEHHDRCPGWVGFVLIDYPVFPHKQRFPPAHSGQEGFSRTYAFTFSDIAYYFAQNPTDTDQAFRQTMALQDAAAESNGIPMLICTDHESGSVYRLVQKFR